MRVPPVSHFHLVIETPRANLTEGMKWLLGTYTCRFNHKHKLFGHLFSGRYKAKPVDAGGTGYLKSACDYVHLNPVRAGLLSPEQPLQSYRWSSYPLYLLLPESRPAWLRTDLSWSAVSASVPGNGNIVSLADTNAVADKRFYRVHAQ